MEEGNEVVEVKIESGPKKITGGGGIRNRRTIRGGVKSSKE